MYDRPDLEVSQVTVDENREQRGPADVSYLVGIINRAEEDVEERRHRSCYWVLGGKAEGLEVPSLDMRTQDKEARKAQAPSHLASRSMLAWVERSGRTCDVVSRQCLDQGHCATYKNHSGIPSAGPRPSS